jgi:hypothetical protein
MGPLVVLGDTPQRIPVIHDARPAAGTLASVLSTEPKVNPPSGARS